MLNEPNLAQAIQFALTPVFLLTAIGSMLNVVAQRLGRVIDRARLIEAALPTAPKDYAHAIAELIILDRRMALANRAVSLCVTSGLFACILIGALFVAAVTPIHASRFVPALFIIVMALLIAGLSAFLLEVQIATRTVRVRTDLIAGLPPPRSA